MHTVSKISEPLNMNLQSIAYLQIRFTLEIVQVRYVFNPLIKIQTEINSNQSLISYHFSSTRKNSELNQVGNFDILPLPEGGGISAQTDEVKYTALITSAS